MTIIVTRPNEGIPIDLNILKTILPQGSFPSQETLNTWIKVAVQWLEMKLNQSFLTQNIQIVSRNNRIPLSRGPFKELLEVKQKSKTLQKSEYVIEKNAAGIEEVSTVFQWNSPQISVEYVAGYGDSFESVPIVFRQVIMSTVKRLCEHSGDPKCLNESIEPWLGASYRSYRLP